MNKYTSVKMYKRWIFMHLLKCKEIGKTWRGCLVLVWLPSGLVLVAVWYPEPENRVWRDINDSRRVM